MDPTCLPQVQGDSDRMKFGLYGGDMVVTQVGIGLSVPTDETVFVSDNWMAPFLFARGNKIPGLEFHWKATPR